MFLTIDQIAKIAPAAVAETHDGKRSDRYAFIPTVDIIRSMEENDWGVTRVMSPRARKQSSIDFGKHVICFRSMDKHVSQVGDSHMEILIMNSHNGASRLDIRAGIFRLVCTNGMIVSTMVIGNFSHQHTGFSMEDAHNLIVDYLSRTNKVQESMDKFRTITLDKNEQEEYAYKAGFIRWGDKISKANAPELLLSRRPDDKGDDLWHTFNRVQENVTKGGFKLEKRTSRPLQQIREDIRINEELWNLTEEYANVA